MRLTRHTDYSLRVLMYAATLWERGELASIHAIARDFAISENHLMKVVHRLGQAGFLHTRRGRNGGFALARAPSDIRLGDVVRAMEEDLALVECFDGGATECPLHRACGLAGVFADARSAFFAELDRRRLADVVPKPRKAVTFPVSLQMPRARVRPTDGN
jgi:Rrf2 family nitric oxide-sensitive transcriptional repressor